MDEAQRKLGDIRHKYQRLLINIEALKNSLDEELPVHDEKTLKDTIDHIFELASELAQDLREFEID